MSVPTREEKENIFTVWWIRWLMLGTKIRRRVWIDSQTEEEILRGIREAKPLSEYDHLADAAYLRAKEDYLMGINFSQTADLEVWSVDVQLSGYKVYGYFCGPCDDLCAWHGGAART